VEVVSPLVKVAFVALWSIKLEIVPLVVHVNVTLSYKVDDGLVVAVKFAGGAIVIAVTTLLHAEFAAALKARTR